MIWTSGRQLRIVVHFLFAVFYPLQGISALWYPEPNAVGNAIGYAKFYSCSRDAVIRVYDEVGNVIAMSFSKNDRTVQDKHCKTSTVGKLNMMCFFQHKLFYRSP
jgi:hypothetical protein